MKLPFMMGNSVAKINLKLLNPVSFWAKDMDPSKNLSLSTPAQPEPAAASEAPVANSMPLFRQCEVLIAVATMVLAVFLASFAARNSDYWLHLGTGKALINGTYTFGSHPFTYTSEDIYWVNHSWLYDLFSYVLHIASGGWALVAIKAALMGFLALLLIRLGRQPGAGEQTLWFPALCAGLAVLALAPWLSLRPVVVSYLFLALTWLFLEKGTIKIAEIDFPVNPSAPALLNKVLRAYWPLLVLFALWVNLDAWFWLGPLTVALFTLGHWLAARFGTEQAEEAPALAGDSSRGRPALPVVLGVAAGLGLLACLISPHHLFAFQLPTAPGFSANADLLRQDLSWRNQGMSALSVTYFWPGGRFNPAALAWGLLLGLGAWSLYKNWSGRVWWQVPVLGVFALLSLYQAHLVPFFAVVAAPLSARNLQEISLRSRETHPDPHGTAQTWARVARPLVGLGALGLLVAAWPGWLQPATVGGGEARRWEVMVDPSLKEAAEQLARWRRDGVTAGVHGMNSSLELAHYCAWFGQEEKSFLNAALPASGTVVKDYLTLRQQLIIRTLAPKAPAVHGFASAQKIDAADLLRQYGIRYLALHVGPREKAEVAFKILARDDEDWSLIYLRGNVAIFAWNDPSHPVQNDPFASLHLDLETLARHPQDGLKTPVETPPGAYPDAPAWWQPFVHSPPAPALAREQAGLYLHYFEARTPHYFRENSKLWSVAQVGGLAGDLAGPSSWPAEILDVGLRLNALSLLTAEEKGMNEAAFFQFQLFQQTRAAGPVESLLLAIAAARQGIAEDPHDAQAYLILGEAYYRLYFTTQERLWSQPLPSLSQLRAFQMMSAFQQAVRLKPDLARGHERLAELYGPQKLQYADLMLEHLKLFIKYQHRVGPPSPALSAEFEQRLAILEKQAEILEKNVQELLAKFAARSPHLTLLEQATLAHELGLAGKTLQTLLDAEDPFQIERVGTEEKLNLLLHTGQLRRAEEWLDTNQEQLVGLLGKKTYFINQACVAAARGDYLLADQYLEMLLNPNPTTEAELRENSEITSLRGLLALETGDLARAEELFGAVLALGKGIANLETPAQYPARNLAQGYLELIEKHKK